MIRTAPLQSNSEHGEQGVAADRDSVLDAIQAECNPSHSTGQQSAASLAKMVPVTVMKPARATTIKQQPKPLNSASQFPSLASGIPMAPQFIACPTPGCICCAKTERCV